MSNVRRPVVECGASALCQGRCACVHGRMKRFLKAAVSRCSLAAVARAVRPLAASARPCPIGRGSFAKHRGCPPAVCFAHHLLALGLSGTGFARAASVCALVRQALRPKNASHLRWPGRLFALHKLQSCRSSAGRNGLTKNTNAKPQVSVPASFAARCLGHSGGCHPCIPSAA